MQTGVLKLKKHKEVITIKIEVVVAFMEKQGVGIGMGLKEEQNGWLGKRCLDLELWLQGSSPYDT